jgi:hypothetical protein
MPDFWNQANRMYRKLGFVECPPYYETPVEGTLFFTLVL